MTLEVGPYMNEDGDWWVPVEAEGAHVSQRWAREVILGCLSYDIPEDGTLVYKGKVRTLICTAHPAHDVGPDCDSECSVLTEAWHFVENRRW